MKISYNWLRQYIETSLSPFELSKILTNIGLEVEGMESFDSVKGGLEGIIIGKVLTCEKHPNADKLFVTTVDIGIGNPLPIVCGAPNVKAQQKVPVATVGTTLYKGDETFEIKKTKIRGEVSEGMICAEDELGLGNNHDGIMVLDEKIKPGTRANEYFNIEKDTVFEIGLTPNRIDSASHYGVARDLAAYFKQQGNVTFNKPSIENFSPDNHNTPCEIIIENKEACSRYSGLTISGVQVEESPDWLKNKLKAIGLNPINNVVDITNYILHGFGQPLHAFDADKIPGNKIIVKTLPDKTSFVTLDEKEIKLSEEDLMICNENEGMCIAGVFGGVDSGVTNKTTNIFLESAYFNPVFIRKTAKRHSLSTDASFRFERGTDPDITVYALKYAALLIKEIAGGEISSDVVDVYPEKIEPFTIDFSYDNARALIGQDIDNNTMNNILNALEININNQTDSVATLSVPPYRVDVQREADIVEEILRIYGYNNIDLTNKLISTITYAEKPDKDKLRNTVSDMLSSNGFNEIMSNSLTKADYFKNIKEVKNNLVYLFNPLSNELNIYRPTLLFSGLEAVSYNINRQRNNLRFYEMGNCYTKQPSKNDNPLDKYIEKEFLGIFLYGKDIQNHWNADDKPFDFYHIKGYTELVLKRLGLTTGQFNLQETSSDYFDFCINYLIDNKQLARAGIVSKNITNGFDIEEDVFFAEINWEVLFNTTKKLQVEFKKTPKFPEVSRDLALLVNKKIKFEEIKDVACKTEKKLLKNVSLFDVFEDDKKLGKENKSYAVRFVFQNPHKTLTDKEIDKVMDNLMNNYKKELQAIIR